MLSPIALNVFAAISIPLSVTLNEHDAWRAVASVVPQFTVVVPSGKLAPDCGEHVVVMGDWPAVTIGSVYVTACDAAATPVTDTSAGHAICGGFVVGLVGPAGTPGDVFEPQAAVRTNAAAAANRAVNL
jgi:hypothetical protein